MAFLGSEEQTKRALPGPVLGSALPRPLSRSQKRISGAASSGAGQEMISIEAQKVLIQKRSIWMRAASSSGVPIHTAKRKPSFPSPFGGIRSPFDLVFYIIPAPDFSVYFFRPRQSGLPPFLCINFFLIVPQVQAPRLMKAGTERGLHRAGKGIPKDQ